MPSLLRHVTLGTGHWRESPRAEVRGEVIRELAPLLWRAIAGDTVAIPRVDPECVLTAAAGGDALLATLWGPPLDDGQEVPILTTGVARGPAAGPLWRLLHETAVGLEPVTPADQPPPLPWCGDRIEVGAAVYPLAMRWTGDWSRCLAWTWIARGEPTSAELRPPPRPVRRARPLPSGPVRRAPRRRR